MKNRYVQVLVALILAVSVILSVSMTSLADSSYEDATDITEDYSWGEEESTEAQDPFEHFGDVNNDGKITAFDARLLLRCSAQLEPITSLIFERGDYNSDGVITAADARTALRVSCSVEKLVCILYGHEYEDFVVLPDCVNEGYTTQKCTQCGYTDGSRKDVVSVGGHTLVETVTPATCTVPGYFVSSCSVCGFVAETYETAPVTDHTFSEWTEYSDYKERKCTVCGFAERFEYDRSIFLTFDDGPGQYTSRLLGILRKYDVKATFFVTNQFPSYVHLVEDIVNDGHAIGVHSLTHEWSIYRSESSYLADFNKMHDIILERTGVDTKIFRFPGGTNNTISRNYAYGIMNRLVDTMTDKGYVYFDWNVDCGDTLGYSASRIANTTINQISGRKNSIVLMHDIRYNTIEAISTIIEWGLDNGYSFRTLNEYSPTVQFRPVN